MKISILLPYKENFTPIYAGAVALFVKDRREHVDEKIKPALDDDKIVLMDRYYYSTIAYQAAAGIDVERIRKDNEFAQAVALNVAAGLIVSGKENDFKLAFDKSIKHFTDFKQLNSTAMCKKE